jgi:hypothetical protein
LVFIVLVFGLVLTGAVTSAQADVIGLSHWQALAARLLGSSLASLRCRVEGGARHRWPPAR